MKRNDVINELKNYFDIRELVCSHTHRKFGDKSWQFLNTELLQTLLTVRRDILKSAITVNNWHQGGSFSQRGLRCNICELVKNKTRNNQIYLSAHCNGAGIDFNATGIPAAGAREKIKQNEALLPFPVRLEEDVTWIHLDTYDLCNGKKINQFKG